jgi:hypothetical protein
MANGTLEPASPRLPIRRNLALLSAAVAANASVLQLTSAVASISLARRLGLDRRRDRGTRDRCNGLARRSCALDPARRDRTATPPAIRKRLPEEDAMHAYLTVILAEQRAADLRTAR